MDKQRASHERALPARQALHQMRAYDRSLSKNHGEPARVKALAGGARSVKKHAEPYLLESPPVRELGEVDSVLDRIMRYVRYVKKGDRLYNSIRDRLRSLLVDMENGRLSKEEAADGWNSLGLNVYVGDYLTPGELNDGIDDMWNTYKLWFWQHNPEK